MALVPQVVGAVGDRVPVVAAGGLFDGGAWPSLASGPTACGWAPASSPPRGRAVPAQGGAAAIGEDGTVISRGYTGKTCRVVRNDYTQYWEEHTDELQPFRPSSCGR